MANSVYKINKGINNPIVFQGLKGQYIGYLALGLIGLLLLFVILYLAGVNMFLCLGITVIMGVSLFIVVFRLSNKYGQSGLAKKMAHRNVPHYLMGQSRNMFINLKK